MTTIIDDASVVEGEGDAPPSDVGPSFHRRTVARRIRRVAMRPRRLLVKTHRWLSFVLLSWLIVISTTGAWLAVHDSIGSWIHSDRYATTAGDVGIQAAADSALAKAGEGSTVEYAQTPRNSRGVYKIGLTVPVESPSEGEEPEGRYLMYFVDPGSGAVNGVVDDEEGASWWLYRGHMYLWQDNGILGVFDADSGWCKRDAAGAEPGGAKGVICDAIPDGGDMVAWFAVGWLVVLVSGFYLWYWPGVRRWATALVIKRKRGAFALNMSIHKLVGLVVWVPLTMIAFTGAAFAFPNISAWYDNATPAQRDFSLWSPAEVTSEPADGRTALDMDRLIDLVGDRYPGREFDGITPPVDETGTFSAWVTRGYSPWTREDTGGNVYMLFDQYSGATLYDGIPGEGNVFDQAWDDYSFPLHSGDFAGTSSRILWVVIGLSPVALGTTGIVMNRIRHRKRARRQESGADGTMPKPA